MNELGWCTGIDQVELVQAAGFDYIECPLAALNLEDSLQSKGLIRKYQDSPLPVKAVNVFFPGVLKVVGPEADTLRIQRYVAAAASALNLIGTKIAVFGSGNSRFIPEGWEKDKAEEQLLNLLHTMAGEFAGTGVTLAIEPLNKAETNIINSVGEAVKYAQLVDHPQIRVLADFYHMDEEKEALENLLIHKEWLAHIHIADTGRLSPGTGSYPYPTFKAYLKEMGYTGMISAECNEKELDKVLPTGHSFMKMLWKS